MTMSLRTFLSVLCPDCNSVCRLCCDKSWRMCQGRHQQSLNYMIRFRVKIAFLVTEIFVFYIQAKSVFCIQAKACFVFRQKRVLYSGKSDLFLAFAQWHGVMLSEILEKGGCGGRSPPPKMGAWGPKVPSLADLLLCLDKVSKVRLG